MQDRMIDVNGVRLHVQEYPANGEPVLFVGFSGANAAMWNGVVPHFLPDYHVLVVEPRGHGRSDKPADGYTREIMAREIAGVLDGLGIDRAHLVGSSFGAEVLSMFAALYPDRAITLTAEGAYQNCFGRHGAYDTPEAEIPAKLAELRAARKERDDAKPQSFPTAEAMFTHLREMWQGWGLWNEVLEAMVRGSIAQAPDGTCVNACPRHVVDQYMEDFWLARFEETFERVQCPVLFLPSAEDAASPVAQESIAWLRSLLRESRVVEIPEILHALGMMLQPDEVASAVRTFHNELGVR